VFTERERERKREEEKEEKEETTIELLFRARTSSFTPHSYLVSLDLARAMQTTAGRH